MKILPRDNEYRTQEKAIAYHNERKERMLSLPDIFQSVKENNTEGIEQLRSRTYLGIAKAMAEQWG